MALRQGEIHRNFPPQNETPPQKPSRECFGVLHWGILFAKNIPSLRDPSWPLSNCRIVTCASTKMGRAAWTKKSAGTDYLIPLALAFNEFQPPLCTVPNMCSFPTPGVPGVPGFWVPGPMIQRKPGTSPGPLARNLSRWYVYGTRTIVNMHHVLNHLRATLCFSHIIPHFETNPNHMCAVWNSLSYFHDVWFYNSV